MNINLILKFMVLAFLSIQYQNVFAKQTGASLEISFTGHLMGRRSCMVNENKIIYIDFGSVGLKKISTKEAIKPIDYVLNCSGANEANSVEMTLKAISIPGHPATMQASQLGLWLTFINSENEQNLNESFSVRDWHNPPKLEIRLDKDPSVALQATSFTAVATLIAEYF